MGFEYCVAGEDEGSGVSKHRRSMEHADDDPN